MVASSAPTGLPLFVVDHAPLVHLCSKDPYRPSSIAAQLTNTRPRISFKDVSFPTKPLTLQNIDQLNSIGSKNGTDVYLTSNSDITTDPTWLKGVKIDTDGGAGEEKTCVIIAVDKGDGVVDAFYFYFFAFNWGGIVLGKQLGDHVGDWEHNMIRFVNGIPKYVWFSQHSNGEAYAFSALKKDASGKRPLSFCANGSHALYATPGTHDHTIPNLNLPLKLLLVDETDSGPIYDPILSSYVYSYSLSPKSFSPYDPSHPVGYLYYTGRWGDEEYPINDKRQQDLAGNRKYVGGPTGPADKQLDRKDVWPSNSFSKGQKIRTGLDPSGGSVKDFFGKLNCFGKKKQKNKMQKVLVSGEKVE